MADRDLEPLRRSLAGRFEVGDAAEAAKRIARGAGTPADKPRASAFLTEACARKVTFTCDPVPELE